MNLFNPSLAKARLVGLLTVVIAAAIILGGLAIVAVVYAVPVALLTQAGGWGVGLVSIPFAVYLGRLILRPTFAVQGERNAFACLVYGATVLGFIVGLFI